MQYLNEMPDVVVMDNDGVVWRHLLMQLANKIKTMIQTHETKLF